MKRKRKNKNKNSSELSKYLLYTIIINRGKASKVSKYAYKHGIKSSTIIAGQGTVKQGFLNFLGFYEEAKEVVMMIADQKTGDQAMKKISHKFKMEKPYRGIAFSMPISEVRGIPGLEIKPEIKETTHMKYQVIFTIVNRGLADQVVEASIEGGARGGTILHGRGSGIDNAPKFFNIEIEPEKEIVMIIVDSEIKDNVVEVISNKMEIDQPNKGILFVVDLADTFGLYKGDRLDKN